MLKLPSLWCLNYQGRFSHIVSTMIFYPIQFCCTWKCIDTTTRLELSGYCLRCNRSAVYLLILASLVYKRFLNYFMAIDHCNALWPVLTVNVLTYGSFPEKSMTQTTVEKILLVKISVRLSCTAFKHRL